MQDVLAWLSDRTLLVVLVAALLAVIGYLLKRQIEGRGPLEEAQLEKTRLEVLKLRVEIPPLVTDRDVVLLQRNRQTVSLRRIIAIHAGNEALLGGQLLDLMPALDASAEEASRLEHMVETARWTFHTSYEFLVDEKVDHPHMAFLADYAKRIPRPKD